ncbi:acyl-CoA dehydrogenase [Micromonospora echinofusca]|uniref:Acyl-CoA dehydrogenase n=1 Tax=Micromonospora echinofusca TaxID=47858 RepID=A0ABS3VJD3_MICEH|nr:acyl-CoA dehydrogenase [Micromonospora echinofusca]
MRSRVAAVRPVLRNQARAVDASAAFPVAGLTALRESGLLGLLVPARYGGLGGDLTDLVRVAADLAADCLSTAMIWAMHGQQVAALVAYATPELRAELLPRVAAGEVYLASVTSERGKGGHLLTAEAALHRDGDLLRVERDAPIVTGGRHADGFLITMRDGPQAPRSAVSLVYADRTALDVRASGSWNPMGMRGTHSGALRLTGTVPLANLVGAPGGFRTVAVSTFAPVGHLAWSACWLGAARAAYGTVLHLLRSNAGRRQFDIRSDLLRVRLARVRLDLDTTAALLARCLRDVRDAGDLTAPAVQLRLNGLKVHAAERSFAVVDTLVELTGLRHGYLRDAPLALERVFRDLRSASLNYGNDRLLLANGALTLLDRGVDLGEERW